MYFTLGVWIILLNVWKPFGVVLNKQYMKDEDNIELMPLRNKTDPFQEISH